MTFHSGTYLGQHHTPKGTVMSDIVKAVVADLTTTETLAEHLCARQRKLTFDRQYEADKAAKSGDKARQTIASTEAERHRYAWSQIQLIVDDDHYEAKKTAFTITTLQERVKELEGELRAAIGYMTNAAIDLNTGAPKKTALATINGGIYRARTALGEKQ